MVSTLDILRAALGICAPFVVVFAIASGVCLVEAIGKRIGKQ